MVFGEWGKIESQHERKNDNDYLHAMSLLFFSIFDLSSASSRNAKNILPPKTAKYFDISIVGHVAIMCVSECFNYKIIISNNDKIFIQTKIN